MGSQSVSLALAADLICPERCAACSALVDASQLFCPACQTQLKVLGPPECLRCGRPLAVAGTCAACVGAPDHPVRYARAFAGYHGGDGRGPVAETIAAFKYRGAQRLGRRLALAMLTRIPPAVPTLVVPVPLHSRQLRRRGYNQSAVLARHVARAIGRRAALRPLVRVRDTRSQTALTAIERVVNVAGAFAVDRPVEVRGQTILLVDDVWTSGSTALAAATALTDAGARVVDVLTFARVLETDIDRAPPQEGSLDHLPER